MARRKPTPDKVQVQRASDVLKRRSVDVRKRVASGESSLRIKGDLDKSARERAKKRQRKGVDPVGVRRIVTGGLPTLGKGRR